MHVILHTTLVKVLHVCHFTYNSGRSITYLSLLGTVDSAFAVRLKIKKKNNMDHGSSAVKMEANEDSDQIVRIHRPNRVFFTSTCTNVHFKEGKSYSYKTGRSL